MGEEEEIAGRKAFAPKKDDDFGSPTVNQDVRKPAASNLMARMVDGLLGPSLAPESRRRNSMLRKRSSTVETAEDSGTKH